MLISLLVLNPREARPTRLAKSKVKLRFPETRGCSDSAVTDSPESGTRVSSAGWGKRYGVSTVRFETTEIAQQQKHFHSTQIAVKWGATD